MLRYLLLIHTFTFCVSVFASHPYESTLRLDVPLGIGAAGAAAFGQYRLSQMEARQTPYDSGDLLPWDRPFAGTWNADAALASDLTTLAGLFPLAVGLGAVHDGTMQWGDFGTEVLMLYEVLALQSGINLAVRSLQIWPRPFMQGQKGENERLEGQASGSFYSGHSSAAFSIAVFSSVWFSEVYPQSQWKPWVWAGTLSVAALTAGLRVAAGKHYPTDVIVGAVAGGFIGWLVPALHRRTAEKQTPENAGVTGRAGLQGQSLAVAPGYIGWIMRF